MRGLMVIGYDGTDEARHALDVACWLARADAALVVNVWQPPVAPTALAAPLAAGPPLPSEEGEADAERAARRTAAEGADLAREAGLDATAIARRGAAADVGRALADIADEYDADLLVVGRSDASWLESAMLGSTSKLAVKTSHRPVLVVPPAT